MTPKKPLIFVCIATGSFYGKADLYINNLLSMLERYARDEFTLICITDIERNINKKIKQINCSQWTELIDKKMRATTIKIGLFNPEYLPFEEIIYLDLTLIIKSDMTPLLKYMELQKESLLIIKAWFQETYNSSVMRIKPNELKIIYDDFASGKRYQQKTKGDQEFIYNTIAKHNLKNRVKTFPEKFITSFKLATKTSLKNKYLAEKMIEEAIIVKFHGEPKVHEIKNPIYRFLKYGIGNLRYGKFGMQINTKELMKNWNH